LANSSTHFICLLLFVWEQRRPQTNPGFWLLASPQPGNPWSKTSPPQRTPHAERTHRLPPGTSDASEGSVRRIWSIETETLGGSSVHPLGLFLPMLFANTVNKELDSSTSRAQVNVKSLAVDEELPDLTRKAPICSLVKPLGASELKLNLAPQAAQRLDRRFGRRGSYVFRSAFPTRLEPIIMLFITFRARPHRINFNFLWSNDQTRGTE
jgi:hypothetical protein